MDFLELNRKNRSYRNYDESVEVTQAQVGRRPIQLLPADGTITIE